ARASRSRREIALVEHQIEDREHLADTIRELVALRHAEGDLRVDDLSLRADQALGDGRLGLEKCARDLRGRQAGDRTKRERVLHRLLRDVEVSEAADERGGQAAGLLAEDRRDRLARDLLGRAQCSTTGRTSTSPPGKLFAMAIALSRSSTSMSANPPTDSFD